MTDTGKISGAQGIAYLFNLIGGLIIAGILGARLYGIWKAVQLVMDYTAYLNLGANHGVDRIAPALVSKNKSKKYNNIFSSSISFSLVIHAIAAVVVFFIFLNATDPDWASAYLALSILILLQPLFTHGDSGLGAEKKFGRKAQVFLFMTIMRVAFSVVAAYFFGLIGILTIFILMILWAAWKMLSSLSIRPAFRFDPRKAFKLITTGGSITMLVVLERLLFRIDQIIIGYLFGTETFGVYQLAIFPLPILLLLPFALRQTTQTEVYDRIDRTKKLSDCWDIYARSVSAISLSFPFIMGAVFLGMPFLIYNFLESFREAIPAVQIFGITSFSLVVIQTSFAIIVVAKKAKQIVPQLVCIILVSSVIALISGKYFENYLAVLLVQSGGWAAVAVWTLRSVLTWFKRETSEQIKLLVVWFLPMILTAIWLFFLSWLMVDVLKWNQYGWLYGFGGGVIHTIYCLGYFLILEKQTGGVRYILQKLGQKTSK